MVNEPGDTTTDDLSQLKSLEDKLTYTLGTKTAIKNAIEAKGVTVPEGTVFRDYANKIGEISGGGFTSTATVHIDGATGNLGYAYIDESYQLVQISNPYETSVSLTVPVPQIMLVEAQGKNEEMSISGDYILIREDAYPQGRTIYVFGDVTVEGT